MRDEDEAKSRRGAASLTRALENELREIAARGESRSLEIPAGINLCSNDYLGLSTHPVLRESVLESVARVDRVGSTGSRLLSGNAREWDELEAEFAEFAGNGVGALLHVRLCRECGIAERGVGPGRYCIFRCLQSRELD